MSPRDNVLEQIATLILSQRLPHPLRVAIDGIDAAGKTILADELAPCVERRGRPVIRASIDGFHRPRVDRYQRGPHSPEGYYRDSFDYPRVRTAILEPLGPNGTREYCTAVFDYVMDSPIHQALQTAPANAVLLFDGIFLLRPELDDCWDFRIFVQVSFEIALQRALTRDRDLAPELESRYRQRYFPGQQLYFREIQPQERADVIIQNDDPMNPQLLIHLRHPLTD